MSPRNTGRGSRRAVRTVGEFESARENGGAFGISPRPHERAALAIGAAFVIAAALGLLLARMCGGVTW